MTNKNNQCDAAVNYGSIHQLNKKEDGKERKPIFPVTPIQAVYDARTGASLEAILAQFNAIYVQYQGTSEATRNIIPEVMRRAGLTITYMDMESNTITERANSAVQKDNDHWGLDVNWSRVDELSLSGDISVSAKGTWIINGNDTGIKAVGPKGDTGLTPWLKTIDNKLHFSYDNVTWEPCSENIAAWFRWNDNKIQISRDNKTWTDLSGKFADNVHIKGYVANYASLPSGAVQGDVYGVGPTYAAEDTAHTNPIYRYYVRNANSWVDNGAFTSLSAGVVQETGDSETEVMSQKAVSTKLSELGSKVGDYNDNPEFVRMITDSEGKVLEGIDSNGKKYLPMPSNQDDILQLQINDKVDKEYGKGLVSNEFAESVSIEENPEFVKVTIDKNGKIIESIGKDGTHFFSKLKSPELDNIGKKETYTNPLSLQPMADPTIWNGEDGYYYALGTYNTGNRTFLRSANLVDWEDCKDYLITDEDFASLESEELWAPSMVKVGNKWNLYISRERDRAMLCFQSSRPNGIFRLAAIIPRPTDNFSGENSVSDYIDAYVFYDREGQLWMAFGGNTSYIARMNDDGLSFKEGEIAKHISGYSSTFGTSKSTEGLYIYNRNGYYYLFASVGNWTNASYALIVGRSKNVDGPYVDKDGRLLTDGHGTIILSSPSGVLYGCGHNGEIFVDKENKTYMFYHSWYADEKSSRKLCLQELKWDSNDWPYFNDNNEPMIENNKPIV